MAVKSIIDIDVNDQSFQRFQALFNRYEAALKQHPAAWAKVNAQIQGGKKGFEALVALATARQAQAALTAKAEEKAFHLTQSTADKWREMARSTRTVAANIGEATRALLKWTALTSVFTGLLGAGGLYGIDRLAINVAGGRRSALGLGTTYGAQSAFGINFGRFVNPDQFLGGVSEAQRDVTKRIGLIGAGLSPGEMTGDTATVGVALLRHLKQIADQTPTGMMAQVMQMRHLDQFMGLEDFQRLKSMSTAELNQQIGKYGQDVGAMGLADSTQRAWQDFATQMSRAGTQIENVFVKGLTGLVGPLGHLSDSFTKAVAAFMSSPDLKHWIDEVGVGLEYFATFVGTPKFRQDIEDFTKAIGDLASATVKALRFLGIINDPDAAPTITEQEWIKGGSRSPLGDWAHRQLNYLATGVTPAMDLVRRLENSGDSAVSSKGAIGAYQITPDTARSYMGQDFDTERLKDPRVNKELARIIIRDLESKYSGNVMEELVAYNAGPRVADRFKAAGDDPRVLPSETRAYLDRAQVLIRIDNNTGGSAVVSTSQVAH